VVPDRSDCRWIGRSPGPRPSPDRTTPLSGRSRLSLVHLPTVSVCDDDDVVEVCDFRSAAVASSCWADAEPVDVADPVVVVASCPVDAASDAEVSVSEPVVAVAIPCPLMTAAPRPAATVPVCNQRTTRSVSRRCRRWRPRVRRAFDLRFAAAIGILRSWDCQCGLDLGACRGPIRPVDYLVCHSDRARLLGFAFTSRAAADARSFGGIR
jgi:hypothetical protein